MPRFKKEGDLAVRFVKAIISGQFEPTNEGGKKFLAANQDVVSGEDPYSERQIEDNWRKAIEYLKLHYGNGGGYSPSFIRKCSAPLPTGGEEADRIRRILGVPAYVGEEDVPGDDEAEEAKAADEEDLNGLGHNDEDYDPQEEAEEADPQDDVEFDIPESVPGPPQQDPPPEAAAAEPMDDLSRQMSQVNVSSRTKRGELEVKTVLKLNQTIQGDVVKTRDILIAQLTLPPGSVVKTTSIAPRPKDPNKLDLDIDIDPAMHDGKSRIKPSWRRRNKPFAEEVESLMIKECKKDVLPKATPPYRHISESTRWPDNHKSELNPLDPYRLKLRRAPTPADESLYEVHPVRMVNREGEVVEGNLVTAFFLVDKPTIQRASGGAGLRLDDNSDASPTTSASTTPSPSKKRRGTGVPHGSPPGGMPGGMPYGTPPAGNWHSPPPPPYWYYAQHWPGHGPQPPPQGAMPPHGHGPPPPPPQGPPQQPMPPQAPPQGPPQMPPQQGIPPQGPPPQGPMPPQGPPQQGPTGPTGPPQQGPIPPQGPPQQGPIPPQGPPPQPPTGQASPSWFNGYFHKQVVVF